jgi:hypothetical protein
MILSLALVLMTSRPATAEFAIFDATTDSIALANGTTLGTTATIEAVFVPLSAAFGVIYLEQVDGGEHKSLAVTPSGVDGGALAVGSITTVLGGTTAVALNTAHHLAFVRDGAQERLYLDGVLVASRAVTNADISDAANSLIPASLGSGRHSGGGITYPSFIGGLDSFRVSNVARYTGGSFTPPTGDMATDANTLMLLNFDSADVTGNVVADLSGNGRHGTLGTTFPGTTPPTISATPNYTGDVWLAGADLAANERPNGPQELVNPNATVPEWSYGTRATITGTAFTPYTDAGLHGNDIGGYTHFDGWPSANVNAGTAPIVFNHGYGALGALNPGVMYVHSTDTQVPVVRWTAPASGTYLISASWLDIDPYTFSGSDGASGNVVVNGATTFATSFANGGNTSMTQTISLAAGNTVDFVIGKNGNIAHDATAFNASITRTFTPPVNQANVVAHYRFENGPDAGAVSAITDSGPFQLHGTSSGELFYRANTGTPPAMGAFSLDAVDDTDFGQVADNPLLHQQGDWTAELFFKLDDPYNDYGATGAAMILAKQNQTAGSSFQAGFAIEFNPSTGRLSSTCSFTSTTGVGVAGTTDVRSVTPRKWYHVAVVMDRDVSGTTDRLSIYVDGVLEGSVEGEWPDLYYGNQPLYIGAGNFNGSTGSFRRNFDGHIDEVRLSSVALMPAQFLNSHHISTWNSTTGNWTDTTKWSTPTAPGTFPNNGSPSPSYDAIQNGGTLTVNQAITIQKYTLAGNNNGAGFTLTLNDLLTWNSGVIHGTGTVNANGGATLSGGLKEIHSSRVVNLVGTSTWSAGGFEFRDTGSLVNTAGGVLTTSFDGSMNNFIGGASGSFRNAGTFTKSAGSGTTSIGIAFNNTGTINVNSGTLSANNGGTSTGVWNVPVGTTLNFGGGTQSLNAGTNVSASGTVGFSGGTTNFNAGTFSVTGTTRVNGGVANFNAAASTNLLNISSGALGGSATVTASGLTTWSGGNINGTGILNTNGGATLSGGLKNLQNSRVVNLSSGSTWSAGNFEFYDTAALVNTAGGVLTTNFDGSMSYWIGGASGSFSNVGTFTKSAGAGTTSINIVFSNSGTVNANSGVLSLTNNGTHTGTLSAGVGGILRFAGGTHNLNAGSSFSGAGTIQLTGSLLTVNTAVASAASTAFSMSGGNINGAGTLTMSGPLTWSGGVMSGSGILHSNGGATLSGGQKNLQDSRVVNLSGGSTWSAGNFEFHATGSLVNTAGGVLTTSFDGSMSNWIGGASGSFRNAGTFTKSAGAGTTSIGIAFNNTGTINVNSGTLSANNGGTSTGAWNVPVGTTLNFGGGTQSLNAGTNVSAAGTVGFSGGTTNFNAGTFSVTGTTQVNGGTANFNAVAGTNLLNISSGALGGSATVTASGLTTWSGGNINGTGILNANGGATLSGVLKNLQNSRVVNLSGTSTWSAGNVDFYDTAALVNTAGGTLTTSFDGSMSNWIGGASGSFSNVGTFTKSAGAGTTSINIVFSNSGTVNANSGILSLNSNGTHTGTLSAGVGGILRFAGGTHNLNVGTSISGAGTVQLTGSVLTVNTAVASAASTAFSMSGGNINGAGTLTVNGPLTWSGGVMSGSGILHSNGGATLSGGQKNLQDSRVVNLSGGSTWSAGNFEFHATGSLVNTVGGVLTTSFDGSMSNWIGGASGSFSNAGTFTKSAGSGTTSIGIVFNNTGTINVNSGTLSANNGGTSTGVWNVPVGTTLNFGGGTQSLNAGTNVSASGTVGFSGGTTNFNAGTFSVTGTTRVNGGVANFNAAASTNLLNISSGALGGSATVTASGLTTWSGGNINGTGILNTNGGAILSGGIKLLQNSRVVNLSGTSTWSAGNFEFHATGSLVNTVGGVLTTNFDGSMSNWIGGASGSFRNAGTFTKSAGAATHTRISVPTTNTGTINALAGTLWFDNAYTQTVGALVVSGGHVTRGSTTLVFNITGGKLQGGLGGIGGTVSAVGGTIIVEPGIGATTHEMGILGDLILTSGSKLSFDIGGTTPGTQHDKITEAGTGAPSVAGVALEVGMLGSFLPAPTDTFVVFDASHSITGSFANVANGARITTADGKGRFKVNYGSGTAIVGHADKVILSEFHTLPTSITLDDNQIVENAPLGTVVGLLGATDLDLAATFTFTLVAGAGDTGNGQFQISGNQLQAKPGLDFETQTAYSIRVMVENNHGGTLEQTFTIQVQDVPSPSMLALSANAIAENLPVNTIIGFLSATDPTPGATFTFALVSGSGDTDNGRFNLSGTDLRSDEVFDFETLPGPFSIRARVTNNGGETLDQTFSITLIDEGVTELALSPASVLENLPVGTTIGTLSATVTPIGTPVNIYVLVAGAGSTDNALFSVDGTTIKTAAVLNYAAAATRSIRVRATDANGETFEEALIISIVAAPEIAVFSEANTLPANERTDNTGTHDFGTVNMGASSTAQTFTIQNVGNQNLTGIVVTKALAGQPGDFTVDTTGMLTSLTPNATTSFTVTFSPTAINARSAVIEIASNDANETPFEINVSGTGEAPPPVPNVVYAVDSRNDRLVHFNSATPGSAVVVSTALTINYFALDFNAAATRLYAIDSTNNELHLLNPTNGAMLSSVPVSGLVAGQNISGLTFSREDTAFVTSTDVTTSTLYSLNVDTGALTLIGTIGTVAAVIDVSAGPTGSLVVHDIVTDSFYSVNPATATPTLIGPHGATANFAQGMDFDFVTGALYAAIYTGGGANLYGTVSLSHGAVTAIPGLASGEYELAISNPAPASDLIFTGVPIMTRGTDYMAQGNNLPTREMANFIPAPGSAYTYIELTNPASDIIGTFNDLPQGGVVAMNLNGVIYYFQVNYNGGTDGNDLIFTALDPGPPAWKWTAGPKARNGIGIFGTKGTGADASNPGARQGAMNWRGQDGSLWMFGGYGYAQSVTNPPRYLNDLWQYDRENGQWIWQSGANVHNQFGNYTDAILANRTPGSRHSGTTWTDSEGSLWLFGGHGIGTTPGLGRLNDLWRFDTGTLLWTHMKGGNVTGAAGVYGPANDPANTPGARQGATGWATPGFLWLFGGTTDGGTTHHNDLWRYSIASGNWTVIKGSATTNLNGTYAGAPAANTPGARRDATGWVAKDNKLWLFGGSGLAATGTTLGDMSDLWSFDPVTGNWTHISGPTTQGDAGTYTALNAAGTPAARSAGSGWVTVDGDLWLVGGFKDSNQSYNDVWIYDIGTGVWTWKLGSNSLNAPGSHGTLGEASPSNSPGGRFTPSTWVTLNGSLWIFGGGGADGFGNTGRLSDLWTYGIPNPPGAPWDEAIPAPFPDEFIVNADPNTSDATAGTMAYVPISGQLNGSDPDGDKLLFSTASSSILSQGTLTLNANGTWTYVPAMGFTGLAAFQFKANDNYGGESPVRTLIITVSTHPADSDGNGIADSYELTTFGKTGIAADGDADLDGQSNYFEFLAGTSPLDPNERLATAPSVAGAGAVNGSIKLQLTHVRPGVNYHLETSSDLDVWTRLGTFTFSVAGSAEIEDPTPATGRAKVLPHEPRSHPGGHPAVTTSG